MARLTEIAPGVWQVPVLGAHAWLLVDEPVTLVDTGTRGSGRAIHRALADLGLRPAALVQVVLTHYHPDHLGALPELLASRQRSALSRQPSAVSNQPSVVGDGARAPTVGLDERDPTTPPNHPGPRIQDPELRSPPAHSGLRTQDSGLRVAIHAAEVAYVRAPTTLPNPFQPPHLRALAAPLWPLARPRRACHVDHALRDDDALPDRPDVRVVHLPGHTPGSIALHLPSRGLVLVGDALEYRRGVLGPPNPRFTEDPSAAHASIERLAALDFETLAFSHFPTISRGAAAVVRALAAKL